MYLAARTSAILVLAALPAQGPIHASGDMVGSLTPASAIVWTRASTDARTSVLLARNPALTGATETPRVVTGSATDYTAKTALTGLLPGTDYWYSTRFEDPLDPSFVEYGPVGHFKTLPLPTSDVAARLAFSGDVLNPAEFGMFDLIRGNGYDLYFSLGDYTYCDPSTTVAEYRSVHKSVRNYASVVNFFRSIGAECIWDDHEVENDWNGATNPTKVQNGKAVWFEYFPMPVGAPEIYRTVRYGKGVEVFLLDCRSHRSVAADPDLPGKTMLGAVQMAWLKRVLPLSDATFKVIVASMPLRFGHGITDSWWYAQLERKEIFDFITATGIENVVFLTADNHYMALHHHREGFREYMVGPIAQSIGAPLPNVDPEVREQRFERNWGTLSYDPIARTLSIEAFGTKGRIHLSLVTAAKPGTLRIQSDMPEAKWIASGPFYLRNGGTDVTSPRVEPGTYPILFSPVAGAAGQPLPIAVSVAPGTDVRVACAYRDDPGSRPVLFEDGFEKPFAGYTVVETGTNNLASSWYCDGGYLFQASNISDGNAVSLGGTQAAFGSATWSDYTLSFMARSFDNDVFGAMVRWIDKDNHYAIAFDSERSARRLLKRKNGVLSVIAQDTTAYALHTWYKVEVAVIGSRIRVAVDGLVVFDVTDTDFQSGRCALYSGSNFLTAYDELVVRQGDNLGGASTWLLRDSFGSGSLASWSVLDEGTLSGPSAWSVDQGVCRQTANIYTPETPPNDISRPGTLLLRGATSWTDYGFAVSMRNDDNDGFGVVFRYVDARNYYRLSWDAERSLRMLTKVSNGVWTVLRQDTVPFEIGRWYRVLCQVVGSKLSVWIDGVLWADLVDGSVSTGGIGLYTWRSDNVRFDDVEVTPPIPLRGVITGTLGSPTLIRAVTAAKPGLPYILAMATTKSPGIPLSLLGGGDTRIWPLTADSLFFTSLQPSPVFQGFQGVVSPSGTIQAQLNLPYLAVLAGKPFYVGGIVIQAGNTRIAEVLPSVELAFLR